MLVPLSAKTQVWLSCQGIVLWFVLSQQHDKIWCKRSYGLLLLTALYCWNTSMPRPAKFNRIHWTCNSLFGSFEDKRLISSTKTSIFLPLKQSNLLEFIHWIIPRLKLWSAMSCKLTALTGCQHSWLSSSSLPLCSLDYGCFWFLWDCRGTILSKTVCLSHRQPSSESAALNCVVFLKHDHCDGALANNWLW